MNHSTTTSRSRRAMRRLLITLAVVTAALAMQTGPLASPASAASTGGGH